MSRSPHRISKVCKGKQCAACRRAWGIRTPATHALMAAVAKRDAPATRRPAEAWWSHYPDPVYLCCDHYWLMLGPRANGAHSCPRHAEYTQRDTEPELRYKTTRIKSPRRTICRRCNEPIGNKRIGGQALCAYCYNAENSANHHQQYLKQKEKTNAKTTDTAAAGGDGTAARPDHLELDHGRGNGR